MRPIGDIEHDIENTRIQIQPLMNQQGRLNKELREAKSEEFIRANDVTIDDIEMSDSNGAYFGTIWEFTDEVLRKSTKRFAEWNGQIHFVSDLTNGRMPKTTACVSDLK